jgi:hypothetical protein
VIGIKRRKRNRELAIFDLILSRELVSILKEASLRRLRRNRREDRERRKNRLQAPPPGKATSSSLLPSLSLATLGFSVP